MCPLCSLLVSPNTFQTWFALRALPPVSFFGMIAAKIFLGQLVLSTEPITGAAYGLLSLTIIGWIFPMVRSEAFASAKQKVVIGTEV